MAEASNPKGDIWWGETGDPHLQAAVEGLSAEYISHGDQLYHWYCNRLFQCVDCCHASGGRNHAGCHQQK